MNKYAFFFLFNLFIFSFSQFIYEFDRDFNLKENMTNKEIYTTLAYNDLYTYIKIGTPEKELKVSINFKEKGLILLGSKIKRANIFNESESTSYKQISKEINLIKSQLYNGYISEELLKLNNFDKKVKIKFLLGQEIYKENFSFDDEYEPIDFSGYIGLSINQLFRDDIPDSLPIYLYDNYKNLYNFKSPFSIIFDNSNNKTSYKGKLILNGYPHEYNNLYKKQQYISSRIQKNNDNFLDWCIVLDNVYYGNTSLDENNKIIFRPEIGIMITNGKVHKYLSDTYFKDYQEKKICVIEKFHLISDEYNYFVCNKEIDITKFKNINLELKDINFNFTLTYEDLFYEYNNKYYFLIASKIYSNTFFEVGSLLMKKYEFVFDRYNSKIGIYNKNLNNEEKTNKNNNLILILSIVILSILILLVLAYLFWIYQNKPRIQRKNEINEDYNYISESDKIN